MPAVENERRCYLVWHDPKRHESHRCELPAGHKGDHVCARDRARLPQTD